jgi:hypothetical protein
LYKQDKLPGIRTTCEVTEKHKFDLQFQLDVLSVGLTDLLYFNLGCNEK